MILIDSNNGRRIIPLNNFEFEIDDMDFDRIYCDAKRSSNIDIELFRIDLEKKIIDLLSENGIKAKFNKVGHIRVLE